MKRVSLLFAVPLLLLATFVSAGPRDKRLDVYWVDVEGGAATLIVTPAGESVLIDTGNPNSRDPGRIAKVATQVAGLSKIDHLITTHYHGDHFGGASFLAKMIPIGTVYDNGKFAGQPDFPGKEYDEFKCDKRVVISPGDVLPLKQVEGAVPVSLRCLAARQTFIDPPADAADNAARAGLHKDKNRDGSDNANSVVSLLGFGKFRFYDGGDLTWNLEKKLVLPVNLVGEVDVYQITHHGLASSNNPVVLQTLQPSVVIMNNGVTKGCAPEVFANLKQLKSMEALYQVHKNLRPDGKVNNTADEFIANHEKNCKGHYIKLSVDPQGLTYDVFIPAAKHKRTYQTK
jgi:competence protein ComEC